MYHFSHFFYGNFTYYSIAKLSEKEKRKKKFSPRSNFVLDFPSINWTSSSASQKLSPEPDSKLLGPAPIRLCTSSPQFRTN